MRTIEDYAFLWLLIGTSVAFGLIIWPYFGAVLWGGVTAIVFAPLYRRLLRATGQRAGLAALMTVILVILVVIVR
jgi:predicted PurR-regulated permease PerM